MNAKTSVYLATTFLCVHAGLVAWSSYRQSPSQNEVAHLAAGVRAWETGQHDLYRVNPPLLKMLSSAPAAQAGLRCDWILSTNPALRPELSVANEMIKLNGRRVFWYITLGRWVCLPLSIVGGWICYWWATELYGRRAGVLSVALWCFSPAVIANSAMITADLGAATFAVLSGYLFWSWIQRPDVPSAIACGIALGLAELTKFTLLVLLVAYPASWAIWAWRCSSRCDKSVRLGRSLCQLNLMMAIAIGVINLGYGFDGSWKRLGEYGFVSRQLAGHSTPGSEVGNRFQGTWVANLPIPLPADYVTGIDQQRRDFERGMSSYLLGEHRDRGWWHYYIVGLVVKEPLGLWMLLAVALVGAWRPRAALSCNHVMLLLPAVLLFVFVSSQTGFSRHTRYVLPAAPYMFVWIGGMVRVVEAANVKALLVTTGAMVWYVASSLSVYPHSLSYFNELVGGPRGGPAILLDSNVDWGLDLFYFKDWYDRRPDARPLFVDTHQRIYGSIDPREFGIEYHPPTSMPHSSADNPDAIPFRSGWYVIGVNRLFAKSGEYASFRRIIPTETIGYSIYVFNIEPQSSSRSR